MRKRPIHTTTAIIKGIDLIVEFLVHGFYIPASWENPAEYPEIELLAIKVVDSDIDIYDLFTDEQIEEINTQIYESWEN